MEYNLHTLQNGIRLVHKPVNSSVAHAGLFINTGSRDENDHEHGIAHLIEHMLFKGTGKRKSFRILSRMEDVGGEINAYTTKEETVIHSTFFNEYYNRALELISDIAFNSRFPEKELIKEKEIILDEINSYKDSPSEYIFDEFEELIFDGNSIGRNILGSKKILKKIKPENIQAFISRNYSTSDMVVASVGNISFKKLKKIFETYFSHAGIKQKNSRPVTVYDYKPFNIAKERNTYQAHCIMGNMAYRLKDKKRMPLYLLNNVLGGPGMNSRLNMALRERKGYAYSIDSIYTAYTDTGNITIYFGTDKAMLDKCISSIKQELKIIRTKPLSQQQLLKAKKQVMGHIAISAEINEHHMLSMGKSLMLFDTIESLEEINERINNVSSQQLMDVANEIFDPSEMSVLIYR